MRRVVLLYTNGSNDYKNLPEGKNKGKSVLGSGLFFSGRKKIINIFQGEDNDFSKAVCLNAAAGLIVLNKHNKFIDAYQDSREHILSGKTFEHLKNIQNG